MLGTVAGTSSPWDKISATDVGTPAHRALALEAAEKAIVLLDNRKGTLPLRKARILVVGANADVILDFSHAQGDRIDLSGIDANSGVAGDQAFSFIGSGAFTGVAGQLHYSVAGGVTSITGDVNGDKVSDFQINLTGAIGLVAADFVL